MNYSRSFLPDPLITLPVFFVLSLGILVLYSSSPALALHQLIFAVIGLLFYWFLSFVDLEFQNDYIRYFYLGALVLLLVVFILGIETRGSTRWISLAGMKLQPSEFFKPAEILFLAHFWSKRVPSWKNIFLSLWWILPGFALIFKQPDLGTGLTVMAIWLFTLLGANISWIKLFLMGAVSSLTTPLGWLMLKDYQKARITSFLSPEQDPLGAGYNVIQATIAVGSGQFSGQGLGSGTQSRLQFLPEFRTDFIFASIGEEFGLIGASLVLLLYGAIFARMLSILNQAVGKFNAVIIFGILGMLFFQVVVNIGMNIGVVPVTGITLPLLSYGGSSLISTMILLGFAASVSRFSQNRRLFSED